MIEQWGTGVRRIIKSCSDAGLRPPEFIETGNFLTVRFYRMKNGVNAKKANERANERTEKRKSYANP